MRARGELTRKRAAHGGGRAHPGLRWGGLLGIAVDPAFADGRRLVYLSVTTAAACRSSAGASPPTACDATASSCWPPSGAAVVSRGSSAGTGDFVFGALKDRALHRLSFRGRARSARADALPQPLRTSAGGGRGARRCAVGDHLEPRLLRLASVGRRRPDPADRAPGGLIDGPALRPERRRAVGLGACLPAVARAPVGAGVEAEGTATALE